MPLGLIGKKLGMTRVFDEEKGSMIPVTVIDVAGNEFVQAKTQEKDGYTAVQVAYGDQKDQRVTKPALGHLKKHGASAKRIVREFRFADGEDAPDTAAGHPGASLFQDGQWVDVIGTTKGKGFQGVVKRYHFAGQPDSHGHMMHRRPGAVGAGTWPGRVWKNQKMPGHHGTYNRTTQNLKIVQVRPDDNVILVSGAVPGHKGAYVVVRPAIKKPAPAPAKSE
ncbi:MAG: 50S ribosomal protein L3 [Akkermansiaceae bacterium]|nr:50S ribosomal protein L3 [Akkermansiaceae bacterium]